MIRAIRYADVDAFRADKTAGSYMFRRMSPGQRPAGMAFICPCGCGRESWMAFEGGGQPGRNWFWNDDLENPTLSPSVHNTGMPCKWHGWLRDGYWEAC